MTNWLYLKIYWCVCASPHFSNVGFKTLGGMQWVASNFPRHWIYSSADDDVLPNLRDLLVTVQKEWYQPAHHSIARSPETFPILCNYELQMQGEPIRPGDSIKNTVSKDVYSADSYPTFCAGGFYTMSVAVCEILYQLARSHKYFFNDDVWITGLLRLVAVDAGYLPCSDVSQETCAISTNYVASAKHFRGDIQRMKKQWNMYKRTLKKRWEQTFSLLLFSFNFKFLLYASLSWASFCARSRYPVGFFLACAIIMILLENLRLWLAVAYTT